MKLSQRSYPHPVLGNRDDVPGAAFQATVEMSSDKEQIYLDVVTTCSSVTINELIADRCAGITLYVECSNTLFRRSYELTNTTSRISIPSENLNDDVEVLVFVRAVRDLSTYSIDGAHEDYNGTKFHVREGDILAVSEGYVFQIESAYDSLRSVSSIMQVEEAKEDGDLPLRVDYNAEKIRIVLSKSDFKDYKMLKNQEGISSALTATIVVPVLVEALHVLDGEESGDDGDRPRWMRALRSRIVSLNLDSERDMLVLAQRLLELPLKRALVASKQAAEVL